ncbi:MAG: hypothetical protein ACK5WZ_06115, partial [Pseudobdellovibrionaceae bacterium]
HEEVIEIMFIEKIVVNSKNNIFFIITSYLMMNENFPFQARLSHLAFITTCLNRIVQALKILKGQL